MSHKLFPSLTTVTIITLVSICSHHTGWVWGGPDKQRDREDDSDRQDVRGRETVGRRGKPERHRVRDIEYG